LRTMTRKRKKKRFDAAFSFFRHPLSFFSHLTSVRLTIAVAVFLCFAGAALSSPPEPAGAQSASGSHAHDFVIFTTVFSDKGFALFGARARVRREEDKKFKWEAVSDHQGELAIRVPRGAEYEMTVEARGFKAETRKIDTREDNRAELTVRMEPQN
jgi:hypothetical protein